MASLTLDWLNIAALLGAAQGFLLAALLAIPELTEPAAGNSDYPLRAPWRWILPNPRW